MTIWFDICFSLRAYAYIELRTVCGNGLVKPNVLVTWTLFKPVKNTSMPIFSLRWPNFRIKSKCTFCLCNLVFGLTLNLSFCSGNYLIYSMLNHIHINYKLLYVMCIKMCNMYTQNTKSKQNDNDNDKDPETSPKHKTFRMEKCDQIRIVLGSCFYLSK